MKIVGIIYKITNLYGKSYIGQHNKPDLSDGYMGSGLIISQAIKKYGKENFTSMIVEKCYDIGQLDKMEEYYIAFFNTLTPSGYNITKGGGQDSRDSIKLAQKIAHSLPRSEKQISVSKETIQIAQQIARKLPRTEKQIKNSQKVIKIAQSLPRSDKQILSISRVGKLPRTNNQLNNMKIARQISHKLPRTSKQLSTSKENLKTTGHIRWHVNRNILNYNCKYCIEQIKTEQAGAIKWANDPGAV